jgi:hypothetical protein
MFRDDLCGPAQSSRSKIGDIRLLIFHAIVGLPVHVMAFLKGFTDQEVAEIERKPLLISMMDPV